MNRKITALLFLLFNYLLYSLFVYTKGTEPLSDGINCNPEIIKGKLLFQEKNCISCHQIFGLGGYLGPDLTNEISQPGKGKFYAAAILTAGLNKMPNYHLNQEEINCLVSYLEFIDISSRTSKTLNQNKK